MPPSGTTGCTHICWVEMDQAAGGGVGAQTVPAAGDQAVYVVLETGLPVSAGQDHEVVAVRVCVNVVAGPPL